jgi:hypothetical protein
MSHGGFLLPAREVREVRESNLEAEGAQAAEPRAQTSASLKSMCVIRPGIGTHRERDSHITLRQTDGLMD